MRRYRPLAARAAKRLLVPLVGVLTIAPLPASGAAPQPGRPTVAFAAGAFSASFPIARPTTKAYLGPAGTLHVWFAQTRAGLFIAADAPGSGNASAAAERVVANLDGKLVAVKTVALRGAPQAVRYSFSLPDGESGEGVLVPVGRHFYGLLAATDPKQETAALRFVTSLVLPASAKALKLPPPKGGAKRQPALSAQAFDMGEHLALTLLFDSAPSAPAEDVTAFAALAASVTPVSKPQQIALADTSDQDGIPDPRADLGGGGDLETPTQQSDVDAGSASIPDTGRNATAVPDDVAAPLADAPPSRRIASLPDLQLSPATAADTADQDGIPDPHADLNGDDDNGMSAQPNGVRTGIKSVPDPTPSSGAMLDDVAPAPPADAPPSRLTAPPTDLLPSPPTNPSPAATAALSPPSPPVNQPPPAAVSLSPPPSGATFPTYPQPPAPYPPPPAAYPAPPAAYPAPPRAYPAPPGAYPTPVRWIWLPDAWRWNGNYWERLPGHWARAVD